jgi:hypothetical protein
MPRLATVLLLLLALAGCGGDGDPPRAQSTATPAPSSTPTPMPDGREPEAEPGGGSAKAPARTGPVTAAEKAVITGWSDALRGGDVERAVRYWRTPAIASNGGGPIRLVTRRAVRFFNDGLTCGAKLESVERDAMYVLATFRLTERVGGPGSCTGVGNRARTLFLLRDGKIVQWLRATDPPSGTAS